MYSLKHEQAIGVYFRFHKTRAASVLNDFKNEPFYEFIGEVKKMKINFIWDVKTSEKFTLSASVSLSHIRTLIKHGFILFYFYELLMSFWRLFRERSGFGTEEKSKLKLKPKTSVTQPSTHRIVHYMYVCMYVGR